nr:11656_t:CDS:2 [Entrophospora candida]
MLEVITHLTRAGYVTEQMQPESLVIQEYQNKCRIQNRETYSSDVWPISNVADVKEHRTLEGRLTIAREIVRATDLKILVLWQAKG